MSRQYTKQSLNVVDVRVRGRGKYSKILLLLWIFFTLTIFGIFIDVIVNYSDGVRTPDEKLPDWMNIIATPIRGIFSMFGEVTVTNAWIVYFIGMIGVWFLFFFGFFILTSNPRFLILGTALSLISVPFEDYVAQLVSGNIVPEWEGPIKGLGFISGIPTFYFVFMIPGFLLLLTWFFWEHRFRHVYKSIDKIQKKNVSVFNLRRNKRRKIR